jgi:GT2 family glycosyltransferase
LLNQTYPLDAIYIIDNASTDGTFELLLEKGYINKVFSLENKPIEDVKTIKLPKFNKAINIHYVRMGKNTGGAGGFYEGIKRGHDAGFDWFWLMDDDGCPLKDCLENLISCAYNFKSEIIAPMVINISEDENFRFIVLDKEGEKYIGWKCREIKEKFQEFFPYGLSAFHGVLISSDAIKTIGFPKKELFIWGEEYDYLYRARKYYTCGTCTKAIFKHPLPSIKYIKCGIFGHVPLLDNTRLYYLIRNKVYLNKKYFSKVKGIEFALRQMIKFLFYSLKTKDPRKFLLIMKAIAHGFLEKWQ